MAGIAAFAGISYLFFVIFAVVLAVVWIILPFAVIGTKPILLDILAEMRRMNALLEERRPPGKS